MKEGRTEAIEAMVSTDRIAVGIETERERERDGKQEDDDAGLTTKGGGKMVTKWSAPAQSGFGVKMRE